MASMIIQIMDKGTSALESLMELLPFRLFPALCDVLLVCGIFCALDKPLIAAIAGGTILLYASLTYVITNWRTKVCPPPPPPPSSLLPRVVFPPLAGCLQANQKTQDPDNPRTPTLPTAKLDFGFGGGAPVLAGDGQVGNRLQGPRRGVAPEL